MEEKEWLPSEKDVESFGLLKEMLDAQKQEFDLLSKKKAEGQLNPMKIKMANRVLEPLRNLLRHESSHQFLDILSEEEMPTNSDVVLILSQYKTAIFEFREKYYRTDKYRYDHRWMTKEYPPDYNASRGEDEYEK